MNNRFSTIVIDNNSQFIEMVKKSLERTENLAYAGCATNIEEVQKICSQFVPSIALINIDLPNSEAVKISGYLKTNYQNVFIVMMNIDGKQFVDNKPITEMADRYLEKNSLFQEVNKLSVYLKNSKMVKDYISIPES